MKANELMIGDWVYRPDCYDQVKEIRHTGVVGIDSMRGLITFSELEPIPLTPEVLEKNGFKYKEGETGIYGVTTVSHYICDGIPFEIFCDGEPFAIWFKEPINIKFVHQLQQALRLCSISKEIEL